MFCQDRDLLTISAHLNLKDRYLPYKYIIGQVILDVRVNIRVYLSDSPTDVMQKNKRVTTVVNKLDSIDTKFRFFNMELLAGEPNYVVEHVSFTAASSASIMLTPTRRSMSRTACLRSTSPAYTGTLDCTQNTIGLFSCSAQMMS